MSLDRSFNERNATELVRLKCVAAAVSDAELALVVRNGWTVAASFAHLALWDTQRLELLRYWDAGGKTECVYPGDVMNAALSPFLHAMPHRVAVRMAVDAAEAIHAYLTAISDESLAAVLAHPNPPSLERGWHWEHHLDQIEEAIRTAKA